MKLSNNRYLRKFKRILRVIGLILLVMLACTGMGLTGAAPFSRTNRQVLPEEAHVEMLEKEEQEDEKEMDEVIS